jgi:hypothetical protein
MYRGGGKGGSWGYFLLPCGAGPPVRMAGFRGPRLPPPVVVCVSRLMIPLSLYPLTLLVPLLYLSLSCLVCDCPSPFSRTHTFAQWPNWPNG